jgi:hypothetical protein
VGVLHLIAKDEGIALDAWDGIVTADDYLASWHDLTQHADWPPRRRLHLGDLRRASPDPALDPSALRAVATMYGQYRDDFAQVRSAIVADEAFAQAFSFQTLMAANISMVVFNELSTACVWLGMDVGWAGQVLEQLQAQLRSRSTTKRHGPDAPHE